MNELTETQMERLALLIGAAQESRQAMRDANATVAQAERMSSPDQPDGHRWPRIAIAAALIGYGKARKRHERILVLVGKATLYSNS